MVTMPISTRDPRWKAASAADVNQLATEVSAAAANLKMLIQRASGIQVGIEHQMGGDFTGMAKFLKPLRSLEEASEKVDMASWALQDFSAKFRKWSM